MITVKNNPVGNTDSGAETQDVLLAEKPDRRMLSYVPNEDGLRSNHDRRGALEDDENRPIDYKLYQQEDKRGKRYLVDYEVTVKIAAQAGKRTFVGRAVDISATGMLLKFPREDTEYIHKAEQVQLNFVITPGSMPEGYEMKIKNLKARCVRWVKKEDGTLLCGLEFMDTLAQYATRKRQNYLLGAVAFCLCIITFVIIMMRAESVVYFRFNRWLYLYSIIAATFLLSRYFFAIFYRPVPIDPNYTPGVTVIIPCFNEENWIKRTIYSCINQDYPADKLEVIVVDDHSNDHSVERIKEAIAEIKAADTESGIYHTDTRIRYIVQPVNKGKRDAMAVGAVEAQHELLVFVDSDSFLDPFAVRNIVQPFKDKDMGGVSGRTDVANTYTNALTRMQSVRYYIAFRVMKAAESYFDSVTCLSGPLSCYRRDLVLKYADAWLNQKFLGQRATFGDDRSMTNFILRHNRTAYQDSAVCATIVPNTYTVFLKQQMRWKRSWLRESLIAGRFIWRKEPFMSLSFYMGLVVPIAAPVIVLYNLIYVPVMHRVFPLTFLVGMLLMALLMSMAQLFLRRSSTWLFGMWFCFYYEAVLLWQMPVAWFTFWKSTWGTRMTPADLAELEKKRREKEQKEAKKKHASQK